MSRELIQEMRIVGRYYADQTIAKLLEAGADALEAKAAPVGELREAFEAWAIQEIGKLSCPEHPEWAVEKNSFGHYASVTVQGAWIGYQAGAAYQRAQQPQSAEAVATVTAKLDRVSLIDALVPVGTKLYTTQQPSAGVVMPERKDSWILHGDEYHRAEGFNEAIDEFARLNGKEVRRG